MKAISANGNTLARDPLLHVGDQITVVVTGFAAHADVTVRVRGAGGFSTHVAADGKGTVRFPYVIRAALGAGAHLMTFEGAPPLSSGQARPITDDYGRSRGDYESAAPSSSAPSPRPSTTATASPTAPVDDTPSQGGDLQHIVAMIPHVGFFPFRVDLSPGRGVDASGESRPPGDPADGGSGAGGHGVGGRGIDGLSATGVDVLGLIGLGLLALVAGVLLSRSGRPRRAK